MSEHDLLSPSDTHTGVGDVPAAPPTPAQKKAQLLSAVKLLPSLIRSFAWGQNETTIATIEQIATILDGHAPEQARLLRRTARQAVPRQLSPKAIFPAHLAMAVDARISFDDIVLPTDVLVECRRIVDEHAQADRLASFALEPRHLVLLHGPPGNGKTMLAQALARELELPFLCVRYGGLVASHLGETGKNIDALLEYARSAPCLVFADEFDTLGAKRSNGGDGSSEMRRVVNQLLISLERLPSSSVFVAATNMFDDMDAAVVRRFDFVVHLDHPSFPMRLRCAANQLQPSLTPGHNLLELPTRIAARDRNVSLHAIVELCRRLRRELALNDGRQIEAMVRAWEACADVDIGTSVALRNTAN